MMMCYTRTTFFSLTEVGLSSKDAVKSANKYRINDFLPLDAMYMAHIANIKKMWNECNETSKWLGGRCTIFNWIIIYVRFICILLLYLPIIPCSLQHSTRAEGASEYDETLHEISLAAYHFQIEPDYNRTCTRMIIQFLYSFSKIITSNSFIVIAHAWIYFFFTVEISTENCNR